MMNDEEKRRICPECGEEVPEGHMYCDACGKEFHMVPEFEPEIENQIDKTLSRLAKKIDAGTDDGSKDRTKNATGAKPRSSGRSLLPVWIAGGIVAIVLIALIISLMYKSADDYLRLAKNSLADGRPAQAASYLESALERRPQDAEALLLLGRALRETGRPEEALDILMGIINTAVYGTDDVRSAYVLYGAICKDIGAYDRLRELAARCPFEDLKAEFSSLLPGSVQISPGGGIHEAPVTVTFLAGEGETLYYTINGEVPGTSDRRYEGPFTLAETGTYQIRVIAINAQGAVSEVAEADIEVEKGQVPAPQVLEDSGEYRTETRIVVVSEDGLRILYETGKDAVPDENSEEYTNPIQMPIGDSYFHFVCIDEEGRLSEVVSREYHFEPERTVSTAQAVQYVTSELVRIGVIENASGRRRDGTGTLSFVVDGTVTIGNDGEFYYIREYLSTEGGTTEPTGLLYAVNTRTGLARRLGYDSRGEMMLMQFN